MPTHSLVKPINRLKRANRFSKGNVYGKREDNKSSQNDSDGQYLPDKRVTFLKISNPRFCIGTQRCHNSPNHGHDAQQPTSMNQSHPVIGEEIKTISPNIRLL